MRRSAVIAFAATIAVLVIVKAVPFVRGIVPVTQSTPGPQPIAAGVPLKLKNGDELCVGNVVLTEDSRFAQFTLSPEASLPGDVIISASAPGFSYTVNVSGENEYALAAPLEPPATEKRGSVCVANKSRRAIVLLGTPPGRGQTISKTTINGKPNDVDASLAIFSSLGSSRIAAFPQMITHASSFSLFPRWMLWLLALAVVVGVPACLAVALFKSID